MISELFQLTTEAFAAWIQPLDNNGQMLSPWIISDDDVASQLVADWLTVVQCLFTAFTGWCVWVCLGVSECVIGVRLSCNCALFVAAVLTGVVLHQSQLMSILNILRI